MAYMVEHLYVVRINLLACFNIFQTSLAIAIIPTAGKPPTVIPIPKTNNPKHDHRTVALTNLVIQTIEKPGVEDAKLFILDKVYIYLEKPTAHAKILFADFSSGFNLMQPHILTH